MAYTLSISIVLGSSQTGLTLKAQLVDSAGADVGGEVATGYVEIGSGNYLWTHAGFPDAFRGGVKFYTGVAPGTLKAFAGINPEEAEYVNSRLPAALVSGRIDSSVGAMATDVLTAAALKADAVAEIQAGLAPADEYDAELTTIQADLDNPNQYKADVSALALEASLDEIKGVGWTDETLKDIKDEIEALDVIPAASVPGGGIVGTTITRKRGDTWDISFTNLGNITTRTKLWFTIKTNQSDFDPKALVLVEETLGLEYSNSSPAGTPANGAITIDNALLGNISIKVDEAETKALAPQNNIYYDVQARFADGDVHTLTYGTFHIVADVTRRIDEV